MQFHRVVLAGQDVSSVSFDDSGDELHCCDEGLGINFIEQWLCFSDVRPLPGCQGKSHSLSRGIDNGMDFGRQSATGSADGLIHPPFLQAPALCW